MNELGGLRRLVRGGTGDFFTSSFWEQSDRSAAQRILDDWIRRAERSGIRTLMRFAHTLATHRSGIVNYYRYRISTGPLESTNTKIRVLQRNAHGFRDTEFFKLKIYGLHETRCLSKRGDAGYSGSVENHGRPREKSVL